MLGAPPPRGARRAARAIGDPAVPHRYDVLVIGGGASGAAAACWVATAGHAVLVVGRRRFPREMTCGDGLTPRAVKQLDDMGLADRLTDYHRFDGLRAVAHGVTLEL